MSGIVDEVLAANKAYAATFGDKGNLPMPPGRHFAILTCMDARLDPAKYAGLSKGDAHVIRNAGGRASDDAIRSLVISYKLLGTREWFVIHHTNCGMETFTNEVMRRLLSDSLKTATVDASGWPDTGSNPVASTIAPLQQLSLQGVLYFPHAAIPPDRGVRWPASLRICFPRSMCTVARTPAP